MTDIFSFRQEMIKVSNIDSKKSFYETWILDNIQRFKVPIFSPTIFKPLVLISALNCLQQCSGSLYIRKFIIQILDGNSVASDNSTVHNSDDTLNKTIVTHDNDEAGEVNENLNYFLPLIIYSVRLLVLFMMAFMIKKIRMRFLYFLSLILTVIILITLGVVSDGSMIGDMDVTSIKLIKTTLLCLHVFFIQFGVQTLPGLLTDILYPTCSAAIMKGFTKAVASVILISFVFIFKNLNYSHAFYLMAAILLVSTPLLYLFVPEIRNVGTEMSAEFFLPSQTVFYFVLPENLKRCPDKRKNALKHWKSACRKISVHNALLGDRLRYDMDLDVGARTFTTVKFDDAIRTISDVFDKEKKYFKLNNDRINFVSNVLGQGNNLVSNPNTKRFLIGRGPVKFVNDVMKKGSLFLFNDVLIAAKCVVSNRRYVGELCFQLSQLKLEKSERQMKLSDSINKDLEIEFDDESLANIWEKYLQYWSSYDVDADDGDVTKRLLVKTDTQLSTVSEVIPDDREQCL